jgi:hypothetical protein
MLFLHKHSGDSDGALEGAEIAEIAEHLRSIEATPSTLLPDDSAARAALMLLAAAGFECYAYASGGATFGTWCVWLDELARVREDRNGRVPVTEWAVSWRELVAQAVKGHFIGKADEAGGTTPDGIARLAARIDRTLPLPDDDDGPDDDGSDGGAK